MKKVTSDGRVRNLTGASGKQGSTGGPSMYREVEACRIMIWRKGNELTRVGRLCATGSQWQG